VGRVTVNDRGTADIAPSTMSRSIPGTSGRSVVVKNGEPRFEPKSWLKFRGSEVGGGPEVEVLNNVGRGTFRG
jgi:hypothetical protein